MNGKPNNNGFTLVELLVVVALIGILSAVAIPAYNGYINSVKISAAQNSLQLIYLTEVEYSSDNGEYYKTASSCGSGSDHTSLINTVLFDRVETVDDESFFFCIGSSDTEEEYEAVAYKRSDTVTWYSINHNNVLASSTGSDW